MDIRSSLDGLKAILGVTPPTTTAPKSKGGQPPEANAFSSDKATLSNAASEIAQGASASGVRSEKVAEIQAALEAGNYEVPASAVAAKMVDAMLGRGK